MAEIIGKAELSVSATLRLDEREIAALNMLASYELNPLLASIGRSIGERNMISHEAGLRSFLEAVRRDIPSILSRAKDAREIFNAPQRQSKG